MLICLTMVIYFFLFLYISSDFCFVVIQLLNCVWLFATPWTTACQDSLSFNIFWSLLKLMSIESLMLSNHLICCRLLLLLLSIFPTIRVFPIESALCIRWPKYWSFSFSISSSSEDSGLISFRMDWLDLLAVQGTLKSLLLQPLWRTVWRFLKKLEIELPYDTAIPLLGIHTEETRTERGMCTPVFTVYNS